MAEYRALVEKYKKRRHDTLVDSVSAGLSMADNLAVELGLMDDLGLVSDVAETVTTALPFAVIAITEEMKVLLGRKTGKSGLGDAAYRMVKTGVAMGIGAAVLAAGAGAAAAIPAAVGTRVLFDRYRSSALTGYRVSRRTERLRALRSSRKPLQDIVPLLPEYDE